ncbi:OmpH family outer membrane protein [Neolewinella litorea]|uniref:OmpH family outer membrane protein n=1 Tax=Neolewinella litorea TaxID=2562452 RepID=A0A4S4NKZ7_9BACT|nr:OmpH family outer membrane protein [Neolewinella litorea]THH40452.1 OmpH family outer membrane protein [Neolewinella litorea]
MHRLIVIVFGCFLAVGSLTAQKYGHLNFGNLIAQVPGTKAADEQLAAYNAELMKKGEEMVAQLRARVTELEGQIDELPPVKVAEFRAELNKDREEIVRYEQQMVQDVERRRRELLGPLIEEARAAIIKVAEENGYVLVFDTSQFNTVLFARDSDDLMALVKAQLGL